MRQSFIIFTLLMVFFLGFCLGDDDIATVNCTKMGTVHKCCEADGCTFLNCTDGDRCEFMSVPSEGCETATDQCAHLLKFETTTITSPPKPVCPPYFNPMSFVEGMMVMAGLLSMLFLSCKLYKEKNAMRYEQCKPGTKEPIDSSISILSSADKEKAGYTFKY